MRMNGCIIFKKFFNGPKMKKLVFFLIMIIGSLTIDNKLLRTVDKLGYNAFSDFSLFIYPIFLSIVAAVIFWLINEVLPENLRKSKIEPVVDLLFKKLHSDVNGFISCALAPNDGGVPAISTNKLTLEDFQFALKNKLDLHTSVDHISFIYKFVDRSSVVISGHKIIDEIHRIDKRINSILLMREYCSTDELVFIHNLRDVVNTYEPFLSLTLNRTNTNERTRTFADPSLTYLSSSFFNTHTLMNESLHIFNNRKRGKEDEMRMIYGNHDFHLFSLKYEKLSEELKIKLLPLAIDCEWYIGDINVFKSYLGHYLSAPNFNVTSSRKFLGKYYKFKCARQVFNENLEEGYEKDLFSAIRRDDDYKQRYYLTNAFLEYCYKEKIPSFDQLSENEAYLSNLRLRLHSLIQVSGVNNYFS